MTCARGARPPLSRRSGSFGPGWLEQPATGPNEAANGTRDISSAISGLATGTQETSARVADAQTAAAELARMSAELQQAVARYQV